MSSAPQSYPWYQSVDGGELHQGEILGNFEIFISSGVPSLDGNEIPGELRTLDLIVLTQSCDIEQGKVRSLLMCPIYGLWEFVENAKVRGENWGRDIREDLRKGNLPGYHLLNEANQDGLQLPLTVVDFHEVYTASTDHVRRFALAQGKRLRLCPPYREHLGQAFARFFMRVGLPVAIPREKIAKAGK